MFQNKKIFSFERRFLVLVVIINVLIIKAAYTVTEDLYWLLLLSIPMLFLTIYFKRRASKDEKKDEKINSSDATIHKGNAISSLRINSEELKVSFGNKYCGQPYLSSIICFEAVSADQNSKFMPREIVLSEDSYYTDNMIQSLNDSLFSDDCIWKIGPDYAGCRDHNLSFNAEAFKASAIRPNVKMIELKLPGFKNRNAIPARNISYLKQTNNGAHTDLNSGHTAFSNPESMVIFLDSLRQLSGKKPVGINLRITDKKEFHETCYAFCKTHIVPDFIVIEGCEKENIFLNNVSIKAGMPLFEALQFVSKTLEMFGLSKEIKIIAASEIYTAFDVLKLRALGADAISMRNCLTSGAKPYQKDSIGLTRFSQQCMERFRNKILNSTFDIMQAWGYMDIKEITLSSFFRSLDALKSKDVNKKYDAEVWDISESKPYRLSKKTFTKRMPVQEHHFSSFS